VRTAAWKKANPEKHKASSRKAEWKAAGLPIPTRACPALCESCGGPPGKTRGAARRTVSNQNGAAMNAPRIITLDIESSPIEAYVWGLFDQNIPVDFIKTDWTIFSYAAKVLGRKKVTYADTGGRGKKRVRDDRLLMKGLWNLLNDADVVVGQNARRFDVRKINARFMFHGYGPPSPYRVVDTMIAAKKYGAFTSQKLAWTSIYLTDTSKDPHRRFPGFELWRECLQDNAAAWREMRRYNVRDVIATEKVYLKLRPWIDNHPNVGAYDPSEKPLCPKCGSDHLIRQGSRVTTLQQGRYPRYQCQNCGGWSRGKEMLLPLSKRRSMLVPN
jgi:hypothetical protein